MSEDTAPDKRPALSPEELREHEATDLPDREAMSVLIGIDNFAMPINEATAINFFSNASTAMADADQVVIVDQTDVDPDPSTGTDVDPDPSTGTDVDPDPSTGTDDSDSRSDDKPHRGK